MKTILTKSVIFLLIILFCFRYDVATQPTIGFQTIASGLNNPIDVVTASGDSRLFIAQQNGIVRIWNGETFLNFLDISGVITNPARSEQGLLSIAFDPHYESNRYFFLWYTNTSGDVTLARYRRNETNPDLADPETGQVLLQIHKPGSPYFVNHNGAKLHFGPDGFLYICTGDGGSGGDPFGNAQNGESLLGKMLRVDVGGFSTAAPFYSIPASNPFVSPSDGIRDEIFALGLRNPWRWSFDRLTGDMWKADVGQNSWEEVNFMPAEKSPGANYGWNCLEGSHVFDSGCSPAPTETVIPIFEYGHNEETGGFAITGGFVYSGKEFPSLSGYYLCADYISANMWLIKPNGVGGFTSTQQSGIITNISSFGEATDGSLYAVSKTNGTLYKITVTSIIPTIILTFGATGFNGYNQLNWISSSENNIASYDVECSTNGQQFSKVGQVLSSGIISGDSYSFRHDVLNTNKMYYRLAINNTNGSVRYSEIVRVLVDEGKGVKIYPTLVSNGYFNIVLFKPVKYIQLLNSRGATVFQKNTEGVSGNIPVYLPLLGRGVYILGIYGNDFTTHEKIIIQ
jgi:glucose/arabinose dehydrogenase